LITLFDTIDVLYSVIDPIYDLALPYKMQRMGFGVELEYVHRTLGLIDYFYYNWIICYFVII